MIIISLLLCKKRFRKAYIKVEGSLVVISAGFGPEGPCFFPDETKDPPSACSVRIVKLALLKDPWLVISNLSWVLSQEKNVPLLSETPVIAKWVSLLGSSVPFCIKTCICLSFPCGTRRQQQDK